ncbi:unnamed protein product [Vitrella brassicaformis CCMP3155]|uniref:Calcium load-activated calcium channel n=1 Tax=Vitrella brassicaformis (strain CCMP3155) TaxID=1169540 RepID=A0A0G4ETS6_VITBC|nr:unnamed protein product [Vitrella brassicaformis CCMP3155]|eukprot:CEM01727.1 unnamed protein product [Vitrella brassicaformis CCMP3155]
MISDIHKTDTLWVPFYALIVAVVSEFLSWLLIYRTSQYKKIKNDVDRAVKKLSRSKDAVVGILNKKAQSKKIKDDERELQKLNRDMYSMRMKGQFFLMLIMGAFYAISASSFEGIVVAKLPFEPPWFLHGLTHRGLVGQDYTDCSYSFLYVISTICLRINLQKLLGTAPSAAQAQMMPSGFQLPDQAAAMR